MTARTRRRVERLGLTLAGAACPGCGRPYVEQPPLPRLPTSPPLDRVVVPILAALLQRAPAPPDPCRACRRPADPDGWHHYLRYATPAEYGTLVRAVGRHGPMVYRRGA